MLFLRVGLQVIEFQRFEWVVLKKLPGALDDGFVTFATIAEPALPTDEVQITGRGNTATLSPRHEAYRIEFCRWLPASKL